jgi:DNA (cytosine-5)-methyltransferase 1
MDPAPVWDDLQTFDGAAWRGVVDLVVAGIPCQPFSVAGRQRVQEERNLWPDLWRVVKECGATWLFLENVLGIVDTGYLEQVIEKQIESEGWSCVWDVLPASTVRATQHRRRMFLLAHAGGSRLHIPRGEAAPELAGVDAKSVCEGLEVFPPGRRVGPDEWVGPQPEVLRMADGPASRVQRVYALGNGVVPLQAAAALCGFLDHFEG